TSSGLIGYQASTFKVIAAMTSGKFKDINLFNYKGKYLMFFSYLLYITLYKLYCQVASASGASYFGHPARVNTSKKQGRLKVTNTPLIADHKYSIAKNYGVQKAYEGSSFKSLFITDEKRILHQITINDFPLGHFVDEALYLVQDFQFIGKNGKMCPLAGNFRGESNTSPIITDGPKPKNYFGGYFKTVILLQL
uniref:thioredoxin-dependent peroxiredoxin n=1 Tax=Monodelphis domestica TaxID=13616 RepID=A0A5F8HEG5_MONDO